MASQEVRGTVSRAWNPSMDDMREGLATLSRKVAEYNWIFHEGGDKVLTYFPIEEVLSIAASKISISCKGYKAGFRVCRWTGEQEG